MSWLTSFFGRKAASGAAEGGTAAVESGSPASPPPAGRSVLSGSPAGAWFGGAYGPYLGENLSAVVSAVNLISKSIGSLPWLVYRDTGAGRIEVGADHPVSRLLKRPDGPGGILTLCDLGEFLLSQALLTGNGLAAIVDDDAGRPVRLLPIPWHSANPTITNSGRVVFNVTAGAPFWPVGRATIVSADNVVWLRDRADNGLYGRSVLSRAPQVLSMAAQSQAFAATTFAQGARLSGVIMHPGKLSDQASQNIAQSWKDTHSGPYNAGAAAILEEGMSFTPLSMTLEDAELLSSRKFSCEEVARLFNIPLPLLNVWDHSTFTNSDTASQWMAQLCLTPWCRKLEAEFSRTVFNDPALHLEIDLSGLMRGSFNARIQSEIALVRSGILTANEVRLAEGWPALPGGDALQAQAVGGRPNVPDGQGDTLPAPDARLNGVGGTA